MKVVAPKDCSFVTPLASPVAKGDVVDVVEDVAVSLVAAGWSPVAESKPSGARPDTGEAITPRGAKREQ